jgi:hypothetical protein
MVYIPNVHKTQPSTILYIVIILISLPAHDADSGGGSVRSLSDLDIPRDGIRCGDDPLGLGLAIDV